MKRRLLTILLAALIGVGFAVGSPAAARADNAAIAINTKDGTTVFKVAFAIRHVMKDVVDETNAAVAYNSCNNCASVAIAFEIVLIEGSATDIEPQNISLAINENCSACVAVAEAYQFVLGTGSAVRFDSQGNKILVGIRHRLHSLKKEDLTIPELQAILDDMAAQIDDVLKNHLVDVGPSKKQQQTTTTTTTTTTIPSTTQPTTTDETTTTPTTTQGVTTTTGP